LLLLDWCDDEEIDSDGLVVPSKKTTSNDAWLSTNRLGCRALEGMDLDEDPCLLDDSYDDDEFGESTQAASGQRLAS